MSILLNKYLAQSGVASRRKAVDLIKEGRVTVNGKIIKQPFHSVEPNDIVMVNGKPVIIEEKVYIILNKPRGYITTISDERKRKTVIDLIDKVAKKIFPVGRLDRNTTGVLLLTNDGDFAQYLAHPRYEIKKGYHVLLDAPLRRSDHEKIKRGLRLPDGPIKVDNIVQGPNKKIVAITLHSGKNRIVRRIFEAVGYRVKRLDRFSYAGLTYKGLSRGSWRFLTKKEQRMLTIDQAPKK